jgi:regulator of sirC expression with transglutaminase-like and TPR domain
MRQSDTTISGKTLTPSQKTALITLLGDEDPAIYKQVRELILSFGVSASEWLTKYAGTEDLVLRRRINEIIYKLHQEKSDEEFLSFCLRCGDQFNIEKAVFLLAQTEFPLIEYETYCAQLDNYAHEALQEVLFTRTCLQIVEVLNEIIFERHHFVPDFDHSTNPELHYINVVLDGKKGNPITLGLLYLFIGQRLKLPIAPITIPGHFLCRIQTSTEEIYIDSFNYGTPMSRTDCVHYLVRNNYEIREEYLQPVTPKQVLMRLCSSLHRGYAMNDQPDRAKQIQRFLIALAH